MLLSTTLYPSQGLLVPGTVNLSQERDKSSHKIFNQLIFLFLSFFSFFRKKALPKSCFSASHECQVDLSLSPAIDHVGQAGLQLGEGSEGEAEITGLGCAEAPPPAGNDTGRAGEGQRGSGGGLTGAGLKERNRHIQR